MPEPTPPSERPLPEEARSRMRAELLAHAHDHRSSGPRWLVPAGAAVAVALVAGMAFWAVGVGEDDAGGPVGPAGDASFAPETDRPNPVAPDDPMDGPTPSGTVLEVDPTDGTTQVGTQPCATELRYVLKGAEEVLAGDDLSYWVKGDRFSLCYELDGSTTVTRPLPLTPREGVASYRVASLYPPTATGYRTVRVAGGVVPGGLEGVFDVAYTFPDGHTEHATTATDSAGRTWWRMVYSYDDGGGSELEKPEIEVTVSYSGAQYHYTLEWAVDTCAQANHGC
jgi:hypothetical protein